MDWILDFVAFGGDPNSITLAGHGTGAACVHFLISSMAVPEGEYDPIIPLTVQTYEGNDTAVAGPHHISRSEGKEQKINPFRQFTIYLHYSYYSE